MACSEGEISERIEDVARRLLRLMVSHRDPERFFIDRSDLAEELRGLARALNPAGSREAREANGQMDFLPP